MKKIIVCILLVLTLLPVFSKVEKKTGETMRLSLTISNVVYVGLTESAVQSTIVPTKNISNVYFYFNQGTGKWETYDCYIYIISFISNAVSLSMECKDLVLTTEATESDTPESLKYNATIQATGESSIEVVSDDSSTMKPTLYTESGTSSEARYKSWQFNVSVDPKQGGNSYIDTIEAGSIYKATFKLTIGVT